MLEFFAVLLLQICRDLLDKWMIHRDVLRLDHVIQLIDIDLDPFGSEYHRWLRVTLSQPCD